MGSIVTGGIILNGVRAVAQEYNTLTTALTDFGRNLVRGDRASADLDAATFDAQLQGGGSDYFFTMAMLDTLLTIEDKR